MEKRPLNQLSRKKNNELLEIIDFYRGMVLNCIELNYGETPEWKLVRAQLLKLFGTNGLQNKLFEFFNENVLEQPKGKAEYGNERTE